MRVSGSAFDSMFRTFFCSLIMLFNDWRVVCGTTMRASADLRIVQPRLSMVSTLFAF